MHVHSKQPTLPQPMAPRPEKPTVAREDALSVPRLSDALSGGGGRRDGSSARDQRERTKPRERSGGHDPAAAFAAKLMALSLATLDGEAPPKASGDLPSEAEGIE